MKLRAFIPATVATLITLAACESHFHVPPEHIHSELSRFSESDEYGTATTSETKILMITSTLCLGCGSGALLRQLCQLDNTDLLDIRVVLVGEFSKQDIKNFSEITDVPADLSIASQSIASWYYSLDTGQEGRPLIAIKSSDTNWRTTDNYSKVLRSIQ